MSKRPPRVAAQVSLRLGCLALLALVVLVLLNSFCLAAKIREKDLPERYRQWLSHDVLYIITSEEKDAFLNLAGDEARDKFIEQFWEVRNTTPGAPNNPYKEQIYERIAFANQWFGHPGAGDGWRTDRGRVYITLGPPQQRAKYISNSTVRPMEIWFYSGPHPALPPFFYVLFFQREVGDEYRLYSPYMDGPEKLVSKAGLEHDNVGSLQEIDNSLGREVARTSLSLLPDEPVDMTGATASLGSDVMLSTIRTLANNPINKNLLQERQKLLQMVTHRIVLGSEYLDLLTVPLLDGRGNTTLHYVLRVKRPEDFAFAQVKDGRYSGKYYFDMEIAARVSTPENKLIFTQERKLSRYVDEQEMQQAKSRVFGYEGILPLPPGKYKIEFLLSDEIKKTAFREEREVVVPEPPSSGLKVTDMVPFSDAQQGAHPGAPFTAAGVKFTPQIGQGVSVVNGRDFKFFYQIWAPPGDPRSYAEAKLNLEYAYGRMGFHDTKTVQEDVLKQQFDSTGTLISGKKIPTADLPPGRYRLMLTVSDPGTHQKAFSSLTFDVVTNDSNRAWDVTSEDEDSQDALHGVSDYDRALCYRAMGNFAQALDWLKQAHKKNDADETFKAKLVELLFARRDFSQIAQVYSRGGITGGTDEQTVLRMAESLDQLGDVKKSIQLLESALPFRQSSALYLTLAGYYQKVGNPEKAAEMERKGKTIASTPPAS